MFETELAIFAAIVLAFAVVSRRVERLNVTAPMAFVAAGLLLGASHVFNVLLNNEVLLLVGSIALALVLFTDASRINVSLFRVNAALPARLLIIGLPLTIAAGALVAAVLFMNLTIWQAAIIGAVLAPTDAGLGQAIVSSKLVPVRIREALNVESGLNDGGSVPFLLVFLALAAIQEGVEPPNFILVAVEQIGIGLVIGLLVGIGGGLLIRSTERRGWMTRTFKRLSFLALAILAWGVTGPFGGSGFIAAFVGGFATGAVVGDVEEAAADFSEAEGELLLLAVFFLVGVVAASLVGALDWTIVLYAVLSLTVIRMLPVTISLLGTKLRSSSVLFLGWFGPRGLASIVLVLVALEEPALAPVAPQIAAIVLMTVILSVFAHGISARPGAAVYARSVAAMDSNAPERRAVAQLPARRRA
ncbi:MAG TPA: cation:proton antiporter [Candidatus Bathyarchaeia archaeon]|nr:cation:proton antiporter [Candidatus Bathyarchaeia archaeon]